MDLSVDSAGAKRVISLAELIPEPPQKRRRVGPVLDAVPGFEPEGAELRILPPVQGVAVLGDDVCINGLDVSQEMESLWKTISEVEGDARAALPNIFGSDPRAAYEERTGIFFSADAALLRDTESKMRLLLPQLFGQRTGHRHVVSTRCDFEAWLAGARRALSEAAQVASRALGAEESSDSDADGF
mmetsp:Transcript_73150/g.237919  ORF Transcript_73150/g.237919 Transcript_73150/m.237919 type:complete len:186 (-) Transcript_73150:494-1051(-)